MSASVAQAENEALCRLKDDFKAKGYVVIGEPTQDDLPEFLRSHRPDALAFGPGDNVVIEARSRRTRASDVLLAQLAQIVSSQPRWRLLVVYAGEASDDLVRVHRADQPQIEKALEEARDLRSQGHHKAALVVAWALLEALARNLPGDGLSFRALSPMQVIERLAAGGYLVPSDAERMRGLIAVRNGVVHGDFSTDVPSTDSEFLLSKVVEIISASNG
jgi:hypothetical protein